MSLCGCEEKKTTLKAPCLLTENIHLLSSAFHIHDSETHVCVLVSVRSAATKRPTG